MFTEAKLFHKAGEGSGGGGGGDQHNLGWYATESALTTAHPTASDGDWAIVGATDTVWVWDSDTTAWVDSDQKGQVTSVNNKTGAVTITGADVLPDQTGHSGEFLTTDGTDASWAAVDALPSQTGQSGKFLTTDGSSASWGDRLYVESGIFRAALGNPSSTYLPTQGISIGNDARTGGSHDISIGDSAGSTTSSGTNISIGYNVWAGDSKYDGIIIGSEGSVRANYGIAIGRNLKVTGTRAIQLGTPNSGNATNADNNTFKVANANGNFEIMSADGTIPTARLTKVNTTITLTAAGWSSNTQTVSVTGVTATGIVFVSPDPTDQSAYTSAGIICSAQAAGTLTFTCSTTPTADLSVNVVML